MDGLIKGDNYMSECRAQQQLRHLHIINFLMIDHQQTVLVNHVLFILPICLFFKDQEFSFDDFHGVVSQVIDRVASVFHLK